MISGVAATLVLLERGEVGRTGDEFRHGRRDHVQRRLARLAGGDLRRLRGELALVGVDDAVEVLGQVAAHTPLEFGARSRVEPGEPCPPGLVLRLAARADRPPGGENVVRARRTARRASSGSCARRRPRPRRAPRRAPCSSRPWSAGRSRSSSCRRSSSGCRRSARRARRSGSRRGRVRRCGLRSSRRTRSAST